MTTQSGFPCVGGAPEATSIANFDDHLSRGSVIAHIRRHFISPMAHAGSMNGPDPRSSRFRNPLRISTNPTLRERAVIGTPSASKRSRRYWIRSSIAFRHAVRLSSSETLWLARHTPQVAAVEAPEDHGLAAGWAFEPGDIELSAELRVGVDAEPANPYDGHR